MTIFGDVKQTRDYVYDGDVARANFLAATRPLPPIGALDARAFNIGTSVETDVVELARLLREIAGTRVDAAHAPERPGEQRRSAVDVRKAQRVLGWQPKVSLRDGLTETYRYFAARREAART